MADLRIAQVSSRPAHVGEAHPALAQLAHANVGQVRLGRHDRMLYSTDASIYQVEPLAVVVPSCVAELQRAVEFCAKHKLPLICRGGGTSLAGQTVGPAVIIDTSRHLTNVTHIDAAARRATVEPGVILEQLNRAAAPHGLMFGPDVATASHATLGGMIGNNSAGAHSILFGHTAEHVHTLDVLLADGTPVRLCDGEAHRNELVREMTQQVAEIVLPIAATIRQRYPKTRRHVSGYNLHTILNQLEASTPSTFDRVNLARLICGAEGTLAVVTGAEVGLVERPAATGLAVLAMDSLDAALAAVPTILETKPSAVELLDDMVLELAPGNIQCSEALAMLERTTGVQHPRAIIYVEYFGTDAAQLESSRAALQSRFTETRCAWLTNQSDIAMAWALRKAGEPLLHSVPGSRKPISFIEDTAVDPNKLHAFVQEMRAIVESYGTRAAFYAHASVGCLHIRPMLDLHQTQDIQRMQAIAEDVARLVRKFGGALSGEHGDGRVRSPLLEEYFGAAIVSAFRKIKAIFDPDNRLNPGNIVSPESMQSHLRTKPEDAFEPVPKLRTFFRYEHEHGFASAVEMCNGAGVCRKKQGGTMCPSYRATLDERHATRGRGNALRLAITGQLGGSAPDFDDDDTLETLRLCLSCKACKSECPSNVDIARLKAEYLAHSYAKRGGAPMSVRAMGNIRSAAHLASKFAGVANAVSNNRLMRSLLERWGGIDRRRSLPPAARSLFAQLRGRTHVPTDRPTVILFADCFTTYSEPAIGIAAIDVLESLGYRVVVPDVGCCGRAQISVGMLAEATRTCPDTATRLHHVLREENAEAIVGCEPSCISAIRDDWLDLDMPVARQTTRELADRTMLVEQFVEQAWGNRELTTSADDQPVLLHAHCHQKALWGADSSAKALRRVSNKCTVIDSGCCGMAGSFGFTTDRYDLSMQIGELALFPAVRNHPDAIIAAPGTSCRHQLRDALDCHALHPIEIIAKRLAQAHP